MPTTKKGSVGAKRTRRLSGSKEDVEQTLPTMRLITLANCVPCEAQFGLEPLETSCALETPIEHSAYELIELPRYEPQHLPRAMPWEEDDETFKRFRSKLPAKVTASDIYEKIAKPALDQPLDGAQRSEAWHQSRAFAITASQFASAANENPNMSANKLLTAKTYPRQEGFRGNAFTEWGNIHEKHAEESFVKFLCGQGKCLQDKDTFNGEVTEWRFTDGSKLSHTSHKRDATMPYLGFSPDALLWSPDKKEVALVEYKCPAYQRSGPGHPYAAKNDLCIPRQYMPQIQGSLHILRECYPDVQCVRAWFVVWQAHQFFVTHVPFVPRFASRIVQASSSFFKNRFLPACAEAVSLRDNILKVSNTEGTTDTIDKKPE